MEGLAMLKEALHFAVPENARATDAKARRYIMFKTILVPTDGSALSEKAAIAAIELAGELHGKVVAVSVAQPYPYSPLLDEPVSVKARDYEEAAMAAAQSYMDRLKKMADEHHVTLETVVAQSFDPYKEIIDTAEQRHCDAIFMASHGRKGLSKLFLGSQTQKVLAHTGIPVTVFH
jgi:nucleotide-binding universal stress UspA family protein